MTLRDRIEAERQRQPQDAEQRHGDAIGRGQRSAARAGQAGHDREPERDPHEGDGQRSQPLERDRDQQVRRAPHQRRREQQRPLRRPTAADSVPSVS
jgi:hypothetical protein